MICELSNTEQGIVRRVRDDYDYAFLRCPKCGREWSTLGSDKRLPRHTRSESEDE